MILIWLPKRYLAKALNSAAMEGEALCSLTCVQITVVLFVGSLIFKLWPGGWWCDGATSLGLSLLFACDGWRTISWSMNPKFDGGCCKSCATPVSPKTDQPSPLETQYFDICRCCERKEDCKEANSCQCRSSETPQIHSADLEVSLWL